MNDGRGQEEQEEYVRRVLEAYRQTPGTMGTVRRADRMVAVQLYQRGVAASIIEHAFVLAAARRLTRPTDLDVGHFSRTLPGHLWQAPKGDGWRTRPECRWSSRMRYSGISGLPGLRRSPPKPV